MNVRTAPDRRRSGGQGIVLLVAVPVIGAVGVATWFATNGPGARAGAIASALAAVASATAALTALALSRQALARTDQQLAHALHVMMLSRYPLLLPMHQSVSFRASADTVPRIRRPRNDSG